MLKLDLFDLLITDYLRNFRCYYPEILDWYSRLTDEILSGRRSIFVSRKGCEIQGLAITKNGTKAKLCHISVSPSARDFGLGRTLMRLALSDMSSRGAEEIHVTTNERVFRDYGEFFYNSGFRLADWNLNRYQKGTSELIWKMAVKRDSRPKKIFSNSLDRRGKFHPEALLHKVPFKRGCTANQDRYSEPTYRTLCDVVSNNLWCVSDARNLEINAWPVSFQNTLLHPRSCSPQTEAQRYYWNYPCCNAES
jgi:hypothetical protein